jgi:sugar phosphate isomerase/epimerase
MASPFKSGLLSVTFRNLSAEAIIDLVAQNGLESIEWGGDVHVLPGDLKRAETIGRLTREAGLEISAYGSYYKFEDIDPLATEDGPSHDAVLDTTEALGARMIRIWPGGTGSAEASESWREAVVDRTQELAERASARNLHLGFEFHSHSLTDTPQSTLELLEAIDEPNVSCFWQTNRGVPYEDVVGGLKLLVDHITNVHCHHLIEDQTPPFELMEAGADQWQQFLGILKGSGRRHYVSIEFVKDGTVENFQKDAATLKRLCGE